mgnify:FL=1
MLVFADIETYNQTPISVGTYRYAETAELLLFGYAISDGPAKVWDATSEEMPEDLRAALEAADTRFVFHNGMQFDAVVLSHVLPQYDWSPKRIIDSMVIAYEHGLPGALADLCKVFGLDESESKMADGSRLVNLFCKPLPSNWKDRRATKANRPADWELFKEYCRMDIVSMREVFKRLPKFNCTKEEREIQLTDAAINRRGYLIDQELAKGALRLDKDHKEGLAARTAELTKGEVTRATQRDAMIKFIEKQYGWRLSSMTKAEVERKIDADDVPEPVKDLLRLRLASAATSATKYEKVLDAVSPDGRLRGTLQFRGAMRTGRFAGRIFQPQNLARPAFKEAGFFEAIDLIKAGVAESFYEDVRPVLSTCLRGLIIAPNGKTFAVADWSNVEGRVLAWLAGEEWKLKAFRDFDAGHGHDLYKMTYGKTFGIRPEDVTKPQRQMGKVLELALGYGGGAGAFVTFANGYGMNLKAVADDIYAALDPVIVAEADKSWDWFVKNNRTCDLDKHTFVAVDAVKRAWRLANPHIAEFWDLVGTACINAIENPGIEFPVRRGIEAKYDGQYLTVRLPAGRKLVYAKPRINDEQSGSFTYLGIDQKVRKWCRLETHGAKCVENIVQATSCDLLCGALVRLEKTGMCPVMHVHDEIVCEVPEAKGQEAYAHLAEIMTNPDRTVYEGLPLAVDGFVGNRYKKAD